ncbi:RICIN domain-containing protein [Kribbella sp. NPDC051770]|uniref:RICIN domain-containing protein n=1 Tax=Kribbella sp. NPDC051770 TaxID=3155413 RepID=UPI0034268D4B
MKNVTRRVLGVAVTAVAATGVAVAGPLAAQAEDLPIAEVGIRSDANQLLMITANKAFNGSANVFLGKALPTSPVLDTQRFLPLKMSDGAYALCSKSASAGNGPLSLSCLDISGDSTAPGAPLVIKPFDGTPSQRWMIENKDPARPKTLTLRSKWSGLYVDAGVTPTVNQLPKQQKFKLGASQRFFIKPA